MKKILFVVNVDWFFISHRLPIALEALKKGYDVSIACGMTDQQEYLENLGFHVYPLELSRSGTGLINECKTFVNIYHILKLVQPHIAHFITIKPILYGGIASRILSIHKKVFSISGLGFIFIRQGFKAFITKTIIKALYLVALNGKNSHVIVQNPDDYALIQKITQSTPITLIKGSGVDLQKYLYQYEQNENITVIMACRLLKDKGVYEFINAAKIIRNKGLDVRFELYGDIDVHNPATLTDKELKNIALEGIVEVHSHTNHIDAIFVNANIIVLPSYREGLPKVLIEASASGRAVVTTDVPGCRDAIIPDKTGLLCHVKDAITLASQIEKLLTDTHLRNLMGQAGRELAIREYDIKSIIQKHFDIYEGLS